MKIKIVSGFPMGILAKHEGKTYDAERIHNGYRILPKAGFGYIVDDKWIAAGHAELVQETPDYSDFQYFIP